MTEIIKSHDFIVTGASGNIGRRLVPALASKGHRILALGRNASALKETYKDFPTVECAEYSSLSSEYYGDTVIHLAVRNNNKPGSLDEFNRDNVDFSLWISRVLGSNAKRFINLSSVQTIDEDSWSFYAISKNAALQGLREILGPKLDNVHIGYFNSDGYFGERLRLLERLGFAGRLAFPAIKALKPTTSISLIEEYVLRPWQLPTPCILTEDLLESVVYCTSVRSLDILVSVLLLFALFPLFIVLWVLIKVDSPGPAIFAQRRIGKGQVPFTLYKFRTMKRDTVAAGTHEVNVSAVTKVGSFLRKTKLDELPQAINLLRGEMTLVGPRPCLPTQKELIEARAALGIYEMKPGITGYAQIRGIDMSRPTGLAHVDYVYMKMQSLTLNFKILLLTAFGRGSGDRVDLGQKA